MGRLESVSRKATLVSRRIKPSLSQYIAMRRQSIVQGRAIADKVLRMKERQTRRAL